MEIETMREQHSAKEIGPLNYTHWTGKPVTPPCHEVSFVPQTVADGWEAYCSCGEWRGFFSIYDVKGGDARKETLDALQSAFDKHVASSDMTKDHNTK